MANANFIVQNGLSIGGSAGATITADPTTGAVAIAPAATASVPNPTATVFTTIGTVTSVATTGGVANIADLSTASNSSTTAGATTFANITISGNIIATGTGYFDVPAGTTAQRPVTANLGMIRYNSTISSFEGYGAGNAWSSLGGVKSVDGFAYISAETSAGAGDDVLRFYSGSTGSSVQVAWASSANVSILPTTVATSSSTGALQVAGGAGIAGAVYAGSGFYGTVSTTTQNSITTMTGLTSIGTAGVNTTLAGHLIVGGNLTIQGNTVTINSSTLSIQDPIINLGTPSDLSPLSSSTTVDIGLKFHYYDSADSAAFLGRATSDGTLVWYSRGTDSANVFTGTVLGNVKIGSMLVANSTASTSTTTGALQIAGGAGISGALYNGGVHISSGNIVAASGTASTSTTTGALVVTGGAGVAGALYNGGVHISSGNIVAASGTASTSTTTGALVVAGGAGISGNVFTGGWIVPTANVTQNLGSTTNYWNNIYAITSTVVATTAKYADLAENYQADKAYMAGTVMMFGGSAEVTVADADTTRVAGIVSTNPAHLMNGGLTGAGVVPLALQGRVPCQVIGPVRKGDIMVSAGHGFARVNNTPAAGQAIGKALQEVTFPGKAVIEVVVGRI